MADRAPYVLGSEDLPKTTKKAPSTERMATLPPAVGYVIAAIAIGTSAWMAFTGEPFAPAPLLLSAVSLAASLWLISVSLAGICGRQRQSLAGLAANEACLFLSSYTYVMRSVAAMAQARADGAIFVVGGLLAIGMALAASVPFHARRMRATLWQDIGWSWLDEMTWRHVQPHSWWLSTLGMHRCDRYAMVIGTYPQWEAENHEARKAFLVDKAFGKLAPIPEDVTVTEICQHLEDSGYEVELMDDPSSSIRHRDYPTTDRFVTFRDFPPRGITAAEYYGRMP